MTVKSTLKRWIKSIDEALLKDIKTSETVRPPAFPLDLPVDPTCAIVTVSPLSTLVTPGDTVTLPIDSHADIDSIIVPKYVQINSPHRIEPELLAPFKDGCKGVTLIFVHNRRAIQATIESIHDTHLVVRTRHSTFFRKRGEVVLTLIPVLPERRYVLQVTIEEIYAHRLLLRYQDPRYEIRRQVRLAAPVFLRFPSPILLTAMRQRRTRIVRQISLPVVDHLTTIPGRLVDQLCEVNASIPSPFMQLVEQTPPLSGQLQDLSLGGLSLTLADGHQAAELLYQLLLLQITLPRLTIDSVKREYTPVQMDLVGAVRSVETLMPSPTLHIRFLQRLPEELASYIADLERWVFELQQPVA